MPQTFEATSGVLADAAHLRFRDREHCSDLRIFEGQERVLVAKFSYRYADTLRDLHFINDAKTDKLLKEVSTF